jgi:hypothetical protein
VQEVGEGNYREKYYVVREVMERSVILYCVDQDHIINCSLGDFTLQLETILSKALTLQGSYSPRLCLPGGFRCFLQDSVLGRFAKDPTLVVDHRTADVRTKSADDGR